MRRRRGRPGLMGLAARTAVGIGGGWLGRRSLAWLLSLIVLVVARPLLVMVQRSGMSVSVSASIGATMLPTLRLGSAGRVSPLRRRGLRRVIGRLLQRVVG